MRLLNAVMLSGVLGSFAMSCVRDMAPNAECDIISVTLPGVDLSRSPLVENNKVTIIVGKDVSVMSLAPEFELTPGATIDPPGGTVRNFLFPQIYTVTSEGREWSKEYTVSVERTDMINLNYSFENVRQVSALGGACSYDVFYEVGPGGNETMVWASANPAFALTFQGSTPNTFPTYQGDFGVDGKCVVLTTRSTGSYGERLGKPIASGNLFIGKFDMTDAISHPLESTHFGAPFSNVPTQFQGSYKYTPGDTYCEPDADGHLVPVPGKEDLFSLYAVLYESVPEQEWLDGTNVLSPDNPYIISTAEIPDRHPSEEWVEFSVPFINRPGKEIDPEKMRAGRYSLAVVMGSSQDGDIFCGAVGSTLCVDELSISCMSDTE